MQIYRLSLGIIISILFTLFMMCVGKGYAQTLPSTVIYEKVTYDEVANCYLIHTIVGGQEMELPMILTPAEYMDWSMRKSMREYYKKRNDSIVNKGKEKFDFTNMKFDIGPAEKIFGPGGVQIRTQGSAELSFGVSYKNVENPSLPESMRKTWAFDFDEKINIHVNGKVGDKVNLDMNYNTDATFDFDNKNMKLKYEGKEDEIIKLLEAGNISMNTGNSLIRGASTLFGVRADLQFGKLKLQTVLSQQESESKTVTSKGGAQTLPFDFSADAYDENRHFFLAHYFRDTYDANMSQLPNILSGVTIGRVEVWITNKRGNYENPRNLVAFSDIGEAKVITPGTPWQTDGTSNLAPRNAANNLYSSMVNAYPMARDISAVNSVMQGIPGMQGGDDYEKIESARLLTSSEYTINNTLGYISLKQTLQPDEALAVAFEYTIKGKRYQVGEFASDIKETNNCLYVKLLKNTSNSPTTTSWHLMMKNVYSLNAFQVQSEKFTLNITMLSDTSSVYMRYIPEGKIARIPLLKVMGLDRLNSQNQPGSNGFFDFVEGYTINSQNGRVYFPVVEPFGKHLREAIGNNAIADKYVFQELYDSTKTVAKQLAEKNRYRLQGEYRASAANEIRLGAMNVPRGSVRVSAGGRVLTENSDYTVDYTMGVVTIINQSILDAGTPITVNLESNTIYSMQRKTMMGLNFNYDFSKDFQFGGTIMHLSERPLTTKVVIGEEPISNTLWGLNATWKKQSQWLTNMLDKLPFVEATAPSYINLGVEFAHLVPGKIKGIQDNSVFIDDFESTQSGIDLRAPLYWQLASVPLNARSKTGAILFPEASLTNNIEYGKNRSQLAWYHIDGLFTRRNSSLTPTHIKNDMNQLSNHYVREVYEQELFPNKQLNYSDAATLAVLNMAYYPHERGPYNLDVDLNADGSLNDPQKRFGGMMRRIETSDFEAANIEYIEFWLLDPFIYADGDEPNLGSRNKISALKDEEFGGYLYLNLGDISEDILKDGKKFFENGLPVDNDASKVEQTVWGRVPKDRSLVYAFDNSAGARRKQDVGLNGLSVENEREYPTYVNYLTSIQSKLDPSVYQKFYESPAADKYHYFRGSDYDAIELSILERYKYINNTEGNSTADEDSPEKYPTAAKTTPDIEDINQDNTLQEIEKYFQYRIEMKPSKLKVGENYVTDKRRTKVKLRNGKTEEVDWYQFKIPVRSGEAIGSIRDFKSIRFMRMFLTGFRKPVILRFATFELVRGEWRTYTDPLYNLQNPAPTVTGVLDVSSVNLEENSDKTPVNYVMPPKITRVVDPGQPQLLQRNEQAISLKITDLAPGDARAVYKNSSLDMRYYKLLKMFTHASALTENQTDIKNGELSVFIRFGSDYRANFYEYEIPLTITPDGHYNNDLESDRLKVWPKENDLDVALTLFTELKKRRNQAKNNPNLGVSYGKIYSEYDPEQPANKVSVMGNPTLGEVKTMMIGIRNNSRAKKSGEIWLNELRLAEFDDDGGWAAQGNMNVQLSDIGNVNVAGHIETAGFGGLEQSLSERRLDDFYQYQFTTSFEAGRFLPTALKLSAPMYFSYSRERITPKYNPLDSDMLLKNALESLATRSEKDSLRYIAEELRIYKSFSLSNMRFNVNSKNPMPYDPANFAVSYSLSKRHNRGSTIVYENETDWRASLSYNYAPIYRTWEPFKEMKSKSKWMRIIKELNLNFIPQNISFNSDMTRHYYELQLRDMENLEDETGIPISVAKNFLWNRDFMLRWDLTRNLKLNFTSATRAEIEEPYGVINRDLDPDSYDAKKDTIRRSLLSFGRPIDYQQTFNTSYKVPFDKISATDWVMADVRFASSYNWARGVILNDGFDFGNTISNQRTIDLNGRFNMESLYNKVPFLKEVNRRFAVSVNNRRPATTQAGRDKVKRFEKEVTLKADTTITIRHNLNSKKPKISALKVDGQRYAVKYKVIDANTIRIDNREDARIKLVVLQGPKPEDKKGYKALQRVARVGMMIRNISVSYKNSYAMMLPGFLPEVGDMLGQRNGGLGLTPGLDFAFGMTGSDYIEKAVERGWLLCDSIVSPATSNAQEDLQIRMMLEPFRDLKIDLTANRTHNRSREIQFMFSGMPELRSGNFNMSIISLRSAFERPRLSNGYQSAAFNTFLDNLEIIQQRVQKRYDNAIVPNNTRTDNPIINKVGTYSPDVMIPAFMSAYTGGNARKTSLDFFPSIWAMMPNWRVTYNGLSKLPFFKKHFKSVNILHGYRSTYSVGSYNTYQSFISYIGDLGFIEDVTNGSYIPSSCYDISAVSINEQFSPLLGIDFNFNNGLNTRVEYKMSRVLNLSLLANQIVETASRDVVVGAGYKFVGLELFQGRNTKNSKNKISNDLSLRMDISFRNQSALCRDIQTENTQATSGNQALKLSFSADYAVSRFLNVRLYYDRQRNKPLVSASSYAVTNADFGMSLRFSLTR